MKGTPRRRKKGTRAPGRPRAGHLVSAPQAIVEAAARCIIARGHGALSTRAVAAEAGVTQSLIHYYFGTKDRLMLAVLQHLTDALIERQSGMYQRAADLRREVGSGV